MAEASLLAELLTAGLMFDAPEWGRLLRELMRPMLERIVTLGVLDEIATHNLVVSEPLLGHAAATFSAGPFCPDGVKQTSASRWVEEHGVKLPDSIATEMPEKLKTRINAAVDAFMAQPWWDETLPKLRNEIRDIIQKGITEGKTIRQIRQDIEKSAPVLSKQRAIRIARTEANAAVQAGRFEVLAEVAKESGGLLGGKEWMAHVDERTRQTHFEADGQIVPIDQPFNVGGNAAMYPGDPALPPGERINCRCIIQSTTIAEAVGKDPMTVEDVPAQDDFDLDEWANRPSASDIAAATGNSTAAEFNPTTTYLFTKELARLESAAAEHGIKKMVVKGFDKKEGLEAANRSANAVAYVAERIPAIGKLLERKPLQELTIENATVVQVGRNNYGGLYYGGAEKIRVPYLGRHSDAPGAKPAPVNVESNYTIGIGETQAGWGAGHALRHELGHHIDRTLNISMTRTGRKIKRWNYTRYEKVNKRFREWRDAYLKSGGAKVISNYATEGAEEAFAEAFAVLTHPRYGLEGLPRLPKPIEEFFSKYVFGGRKYKNGQWV